MRYRRISVVIAILSLALFVTAFYFTSRLDFSRRWLLKLFLWSLPLPWLAAELGYDAVELAPFTLAATIDAEAR